MTFWRREPILITVHYGGQEYVADDEDISVKDLRDAIDVAVRGAPWVEFQSRNGMVHLRVSANTPIALTHASPGKVS
jgi:hypothetical protein